MSVQSNLEAEDVQRVERVLTDVQTSPVTRRALIARAAGGAVGLAAVGAFGPVPSALAKRTGKPGGIERIIKDAVTAEALAVTYLTGLVENATKIGIPSKLVPVLKAANAAELDHYNTLRSLGARPLTERFWAPDSFFEKRNVFATIEFAETQFINAYLIAITAFAREGKDSLARYAGEILGTEAEHRTLARFAQGKLPNNVGFETYDIHQIDGIVRALESAGIGFGKEGKKPGAFYHFRTPPSSALVHLDSNRVA